MVQMYAGFRRLIGNEPRASSLMVDNVDETRSRKTTEKRRLDRDRGPVEMDIQHVDCEGLRSAAMLEVPCAIVHIFKVKAAY